MKVLVACEFSGTVRRAFAALGHYVVSCDLLPADDGAKWPDHRQHDVRQLLNGPWDLMIAHPPCTHLAVSGARWFPNKQAEQGAALEFIRELMDAPIERICIENPISVISTKIRKPDQIVQPHHFGDPSFKATCLWLKNLPPLEWTNPLPIPLRGTPEWTAWNKVHRMPPSPTRGKERSRFPEGIARAMAEQWGGNKSV